MGKLRGNNIELKNDEYIYSDTQQSTKDKWKTKPCGHCGLKFTKEGHDGCLGTLPNTMNACCGHGIVKEAYWQDLNGNTIHGLAAVNKLKELINSDITKTTKK